MFGYILLTAFVLACSSFTLLLTAIVLGGRGWDGLEEPPAELAPVVQIAPEIRRRQMTIPQKHPMVRTRSTKSL